MTVAGGHGEGNRTDQLSSPIGLFVDKDQTVYIADLGNHRIMGWKVGAMAGEVLAGGESGCNRLDHLYWPTDVIVDRQTDTLLICDWWNRRVVRWPRCSPHLRQGEIVIANTKCWALTMDNQGSLYVSDEEKHQVKRFDAGNENNGAVVAGAHVCGINLNQLSFPSHIFVDTQFTLYISDVNNHRVMKWMRGAKEGIVVAGGNGKGGHLTQLSSPQGLWVNASEDIYVVDEENHRVMRWKKGAKQGTVIVGGNGEGAQANQLSHPRGLFFDLHGYLYVTDHGNNRVQRFASTAD